MAWQVPITGKHFDLPLPTHAQGDEKHADVQTEYRVSACLPILKRTRRKNIKTKQKV